MIDAGSDRYRVFIATQIALGEGRRCCCICVFSSIICYRGLSPQKPLLFSDICEGNKLDHFAANCYLSDDYGEGAC